MTLYGVDLSKYQAGINWPSVKSAGIEFSIARASIGLSTDPTFGSHKEGALTQGILPGGYHFLTPGSGADQADVFASMTNGARGILAALDCESSGLTIGIIRDFAERFAERSDNHPLFVYTGPSFWRNHGDHDLKGLGPLWLAYYPGGGYQGDNASTWNLVLGGVKPTIWQYGPRPIKGRASVDGDAFRGTRAELEAFIGGTQSGPAIPEVPVSTFKPAAGLFAVPLGTPIYDNVNGKAISTVQANESYVNGMLTVLGGISGWRICVVNALTAAWIKADAGRDFPAPSTGFTQFDMDNAKASGYEAARAKAIAAAEAI